MCVGQGSGARVFATQVVTESDADDVDQGLPGELMFDQERLCERLDALPVTAEEYGGFFAYLVLEPKRGCFVESEVAGRD
jgi:hypothetical protein